MLVGILAGAVAVVVGLDAIPTVDGLANDDGIVPTATRLTVVLVVGVLIAIAAYAVVELVQTRRIDSIARQFSTRTIVLMPIAIAINVVLGQTVGTALKLPLYLDSVGTILVGVLAGPIAGAATGILSNLAWTFVLAGTPFGSPYAWPFAIVAAEIGLLAGLVGYAGLFRSRPGTPIARLVAGVVVAVAVVGALVWTAILPFYRSLCPALMPAPGPAGSAGSGQDYPLCFELFQPIVAADPMFLVLGVLILSIVAVAAVALVWRLARDRDLGVVTVLVAGTACGVLSALIATPIATLVFGGVTGSGTDVLVAAFQQAGSELQQAVLQQSLISDPIDKALTFLLVFTILTSVSRRVAARFPQGERALGTIEA